MDKKLFKSLMPLAIAVVGILIIGAILFVNQGVKKGESQGLSEQERQEIAEKTVDFINKNILSGQATASLVSAVEEYGLIKIRLDLAGNEIDTYVSKDGKLFFPEAINLDESLSSATPPTQNGQEQKTCEEITKTEKPLLEAFVVSECPYGLQMQRILAEVVKDIPSLADSIKVRYIGSISDGKITAMHGDSEAQENLRQICLREETNKYWDYLSCHMEKGDVEPCLAEAKVDTGRLDGCMSDSSRGLKYAEEDFSLQGEHGVSGSPTLILNNEPAEEFWFGGRTAEALKTLTCCGFNEKPEVCSQKLDERSATSGFSEEYNDGSASSGGGC